MNVWASLETSIFWRKHNKKNTPFVKGSVGAHERRVCAKFQGRTPKNGVSYILLDVCAEKVKNNKGMHRNNLVSVKDHFLGLKCCVKV